jgi:hypothetical protein
MQSAPKRLERSSLEPLLGRTLTVGERRLNVSDRPDLVGHGHRHDTHGPQLTAFFTSAAIFFSSAGVNPSSAKEVGHILPSSRFAAS